MTRNQRRFNKRLLLRIGAFAERQAEDNKTIKNLSREVTGKAKSKAPGKSHARFIHDQQYESGAILDHAPWKTGPTFIRKDTV